MLAARIPHAAAHRRATDVQSWRVRERYVERSFDEEARELTVNLTLRELRGRYKRSALGWTWSLLNPLSTVIVFSIVFAFFLKINPPVGHPSGLHSFPMFLLCGLLPFNYLSNGMNGSLDALLANSNLIRKVYFPREVLVVSTISALLVTFLVEMAVLGAILLLLGNMILPWIPMVLVLVAIQSVFVLGIGLMLSVLNVYFRDFKHFIGIALQALFYTAPIVAMLGTYGIPFIVEIGVFLDALMGFLVMQIVIYRIQETFESIDVEQLNKLRE